MLFDVLMHSKYGHLSCFFLFPPVKSPWLCDRLHLLRFFGPSCLDNDSCLHTIHNTFIFYRGVSVFLHWGEGKLFHVRIYRSQKIWILSVLRSCVIFHRLIQPILAQNNFQTSSGGGIDNRVRRYWPGQEILIETTYPYIKRKVTSTLIRSVSLWKEHGRTLMPSMHYWKCERFREIIFQNKKKMDIYVEIPTGETHWVHSAHSWGVSW